MPGHAEPHDHPGPFSPGPGSRPEPHPGPRPEPHPGSRPEPHPEPHPEPRPGTRHQPRPGPRTGEAPHPERQTLLIDFEPGALRRATVSVLVTVTLWMVALWAFQEVSRFLFLLMLSWLCSMAMEPPIAWLVDRGFRRGVATGVVGGLALAVVGLLGAMFGNVFLSQLADLIQALPSVVNDTISWANRTLSLKLDAASIASSLKLTPTQVGSMASNLAGGVLGLVSSLLSVMLDTFTVTVFAFYLAADGPRVRRTIGSWLSPARQDVFVRVWDIAVTKTGGYVVSKIELAALSSAFHAFFFWLVGVPYWVPLALLVGLLAQFVPVLGTYVGVLVPMLFVVFTVPLTALWIILFATVYQQIETYLFTPRISKRTMDVNSGIALASVFVGAALGGAIGALVGIPIAAAVVAVLDTYGHRHELVPALAVPSDSLSSGSVPDTTVPPVAEPGEPSGR